MAAASVENPVPIAGEPKTTRRKKTKADSTAVTNGSNNTAPSLPESAAKEHSAVGETDAEHPYLKELQKQIRSINKKLTSMQKLDSIIAENPGVSLDAMVAQRKINADQKAAALKKPQLQSQLGELEERYEHYRNMDSEYQVRFNKQKDDFAASREQEMEQIRKELRGEALSNSATELRKKLLVFSQFLRAAAAKRTIEEEMDTEESKAFEGALLLVYGGDDKAVDTALSLIQGTDDFVPSIEGLPTPISYAQVKQASVDHAPFSTEEAWVDQVAEATGADQSELATARSDPTIANAGLTELSAPIQQNGINAKSVPDHTLDAPISAGDVGNFAGERWDTEATGATAGAEKRGLEESYEMIPRPSEEIDVPAQSAMSAQQAPSASWADEPPSHDAAAVTGNQAGQSWDTKEPGEQNDSNWSAEPASTNGWGNAVTPGAADDGFHEVPGRHRGRGGRGRGDGEHRGRGRGRGGFRGGRGGAEGEFRGRGGFRGGRGDGEFRGGRGRRGGPRGGGDASTPS